MMMAVMRRRKCPKFVTSMFSCVTIFSLSLSFISSAYATHEDCPWYKKDEGLPDDIKSNCICAINPSQNNQLSVQCQDINAQILVAILSEFQAGTSQRPLELLYLNGSKVTDENGMVLPQLFDDLKIISLQLSGCKIKSMHPSFLSGNEKYLKHLSLAQNHITSVSSAFEKLENLSLLDLSYNKITKIPANAFVKLTKLATLKLNDNNLELHPESLVGLEKSLRNLNLKATRISQIPEAIQNLSSLAFLDLAQNRLRELDPSFFARLNSLTALNLERNLLQSLPDSAFEGINDTLSSLSLLNNLITTFPRNALKNLRELRVLDLGFNLLTEVPLNAFHDLKSLTLLALDGNPLTTLSEATFSQLNKTLRGISLGGRFLNCDCKIEWILEWIKVYDLQVTSRERNPQFCGLPQKLRTVNFYQINPEDLQCPKNETEKKLYDVSLSPEDVALLEIRPSASDPNVQTDLSSSFEESGENWNSGENKTTFTAVEVPVQVTQAVKKFKPRRNRPALMAKVIPTVTTTTTTPKIESVEIKSDEDNTTNESISIEVEGVTMKEKVTAEVAERRFNSQFKQEETAILSTTSTASLSSSTRSTVRVPPIRQNPIMRHRVTPKLFATSTTILPPTTPTTRTTTTVFEETETRKIVRATTTVPKPAPSLQRQPIPNSKSIESMNADDSKIPVISGVGSAVSSPNLHTGSIMTVKQPMPVQTHSNSETKQAEIAQQQPLPIIPYPGSREARPTPPSVPPNLIFADKSDIIVTEISRNGDSVTLHWESPRQAFGFRIVYRLFGEESFRHGPPLAATETEYRIKNVPINECMVICVVPYEEILYNEINPSAGSVPAGSQCREVKPNVPSALMNHMDKITIGASIAICATVFVAVLVFIVITRRAKRPQSNMIAKIPPTTYLTPSPGTGATNSGCYGKEWDQMSVISTKSIPRARVFHGSMDGLGNNTTLKTATLNTQFQRGVTEGLSTHRSFSAHHHHQAHGHFHHGNPHTHGNAATAVNNYLNNQNRFLRTSLGSRASYDALNKLVSTRHSHHQLENFRRKRNSRINQSESLNTLNGYETPDNWTDHDMDFYVARNHTRHDLVQL